MKTILSVTLGILTSSAAMCTTWTVTNSGFTFSPDTLVINDGDSVKFTIAGSHNTREVSMTTWNANGSTALSGGFSTAFGGGVVVPAKLTVGTHYYVCAPHASSGMKAVIIVQSTTSISSASTTSLFSISPNPATNFITIKSATSKVGKTYQIVNIIGKTVLTGVLCSTQEQVDISKLISGIYLVAIEGEKNFKLVKE